ncbi:hypothetical protein C5167_030991 [Papaver somniferum]|nr:hypothetical protein C5167_030991 [Papaver somniferum]
MSWVHRISSAETVSPSIQDAYLGDTRFSGFPYGTPVKYRILWHPGAGSDDGLPVQFEDLFLTCSRKVDSQPSYHDRSRIRPVGYRSSWHDKVAGSVYLFDVPDGGSSRPVFKVRRYTCSASVISDASIVLLRQILGQSEGES